MSRTNYRQLATIALGMLVGCAAGIESSAPVAFAKIDQANLQASAAPKPVGGQKTGPRQRTAFYRADAKPSAMPKVIMSKGDEAACKVKVGDAMPAIELPKLGGDGKT